MAASSQDLELALHADLPTTLDIPTGDSIEVEWYNARATILRSTKVFPYGTFRIRPERNQDPARHFGTRAANATAIDTPTFASGTLDYFLEERDAASITSVTGTLGGSPHTFVATTDYVLVGSDPNDSFLDTIRWTAGGDKPDDTTQFTVTYVHKKWEDLLSTHVEIPFLFTLHVKALADGDKGATQAYPHTMLGPMLGRAMQDWFQFRRNRLINSTTNSLLQWGPTGPLMVVEDEADEASVRWAVESTLRERRVYARDSRGRVREVEYTTTANVG